MTTPVGRFDVKPDIRYISRWEVEIQRSVSCAIDKCRGN